MPKIVRQSSDDTLSDWNTRIVEKSKIKVLKMLIAIVSLFALSWLPLYAIFARVKFGPPFDENSFEGIVYKAMIKYFFPLNIFRHI
jgi:hypothetical protein